MIKLAFMFMGMAFLLLETKSIIQFSLLFGTTWLNNSLVFLAILILVLLANWTAYFLTRRSHFIFILVLVSSGITLFYPLSQLLAIENVMLRFLLASVLTFSPIFFANLIFSLSFREQELPEHIFGWNLIGATMGGVLEYTSLYLGYNMLAVIVSVLYGLVFLFLVIAERGPGRTH